MNISEREMVLGAATLATFLLGMTYFAAKPVFDKWGETEAEIRDKRATLAANRELIAARDEWADRFFRLSELMPEFPADEKMDIHWLTKMDELASKNGLTIADRQAGDERQTGNVYEMSIDVRKWEGPLDSLIHFLFDLQNLGVMLDVENFYVKPLDKTRLRGSFKLNCAFSRASAIPVAD